ncbi:MAG: hypothetical protein ACYCV4_05475 [Dermatophilaceae bacterium]
MMLAWLTGLGIVSWRWIGKEHSPPPPSELAVASGAFALCALVAEMNSTLGNTLAWGLDLAAFLRAFSGSDPLPSWASVSAAASNPKSNPKSTPAGGGKFATN